MNWIKRLFRKPPEVVETPVVESKYANCDIMHFPLSGKYFPRYDCEFLFYWSAGYWTCSKSPTACVHGKTEQEAKDILDKYLESRGVGTKIIEL